MRRPHQRRARRLAPACSERACATTISISVRMTACVAARPPAGTRAAPSTGPPRARNPGRGETPALRSSRSRTERPSRAWPISGSKNRGEEPAPAPEFNLGRFQSRAAAADRECRWCGVKDRQACSAGSRRFRPRSQGSQSRVSAANVAARPCERTTTGTTSSRSSISPKPTRKWATRTERATSSRKC